MKKTNILTICTIFLILVSTARAQADETWGCAPKDYKCQLDTVLKAMKANPKEPENYYNMGIVFQRMGSHKEAIEAYSMYVSIPGVKSEHLADGYNNRGVSHRSQQRADLAMADYAKAIDLDPKKWRFYVNRANANGDLKNTAQALADYDRAIALEPKSGFAYAQRGTFMAGQSREDDALRDFARAIELDPAYAEPYYNRGVILAGRKEYARAVADYDKYIPLVADNLQYQTDAHINRGIAHASLGNREKALEDFTKVIQLAPRWPNGYLARAMVYREMKKDDLAAADEKKAAELR